MSFDLKTCSFPLLVSKINEAEEIYSSDLLLSNTTPSDIFEISLSDKSNKFLDQLIKSSSTNHSPNFRASKWKQKDNYINEENVIFDVQQRSVNIKASDNGFSSFFLRKNIITNITQTSYSDKEHDSYIIYSITQTKTDNKISEYVVIDKWIIEWLEKDTEIIKKDETEYELFSPDNNNQNNNNNNNNNNLENERKVFVSLKACILWKENQNATSMTLIRSKWLRFYQSRFNAWRQLIKTHIKRADALTKKKALMAPFIGSWYKINSFNTLKITLNKIRYSDGTSFNVMVNPNEPNILIASYSDGKFRGELMKDKWIIKWNNGSIWIKNGIHKFLGEYKNDTDATFIINEDSTIQLPITGKRVPFMLTAYDTIGYTLNKTFRRGVLSKDQLSIKWNNGDVWSKKIIEQMLGNVVHEMSNNQSNHNHDNNNVTNNKQTTDPMINVGINDGDMAVEGEQNETMKSNNLEAIETEQKETESKEEESIISIQNNEHFVHVQTENISEDWFLV